MFLFFLYCFAAFIYFVLFVSVSFEDPKSPIHQAFSTFLFGIFLWTTTLYVYFFVDTGDWLTFWGRINYSSGIFVSLGLVLFFYYFPKKEPSFKKWIENTFIFYYVLLFFLTLFTPFVAAEEIMTLDGPEAVHGSLYQLYSVSITLGLVAIFLLGIRKSIKLQGINKKKFTYAFWVAIPSCIFGYFIILFLHMFGIKLLQQAAFLIIIPMALCFYYAIHHHRFFQFSYVFLKILRFSIIFSLVIVGGGLFFEIISLIGTEIDQNIQLFLSYTVGMLSFWGLEKTFPEFTTYRFREFRKSLQVLRSKIYFCNTYRTLKKHLEEAFVLRKLCESRL